MAAPSMHVVVADADAEARATTIAVLREVGESTSMDLKIHEASTGTSALALCSDHRPRLLISEILLEGLSGLAILRRLRSESASETAVIFVTHLARENDRFWGLRNGALAYLAKPYDTVVLRDRIRRVLTDGPAATPERPRQL